MFRDHLASQSEMRLEAMDNGSTELKWCIFTKGTRAPIAKIIVDTRQHKVITGANYEPSAHIVNVFVRPEFRGKRLGEHLVRLAQMQMRENGFVWMTLEAEEKVENHGRLVGLYERCGFQIHPPGDKFPLEYNGDECYRKVPMRCNLLELRMDEPQPQEGEPPSSSSSSSSSAAASTSTPVPVPSRYASVSLVEEIKREALHLLQIASLNVDVVTAIDFIDQHLAPGTMESAFRTAMHIKSLGHPDWMELAGFLRHIGRIQEKWTDWHWPYMVRVGAAARRHARAEANSDDEEDDAQDADNIAVKSGPLPREVCDEAQSRVFIDPERYAQEGVDEAMLTWTPMEFTFLALTFGDRSSAPREMAQVLRYCECSKWLNSEEFAYLESWGDADLKQLTSMFKSCLEESDRSPSLNAKQVEEARSRLVELVDKYASEVRLL